MRIMNDGVGLEVAVHGSPDVGTVVLLHGWPDEGSMWHHQVAALVDAGYRVVVPDQRGCGASDRPTAISAYKMALLVADVVAVITSLDEGAVHVVGHDWGANVAWALASFVPSVVTSLTAISVGHPTSFRSAGIEQQMRTWYPLLFQFEGIGEAWLRKDDYTAVRTWLSHPDADDVVARDRATGFLDTHLHWYRANMPPESWIAEPPVIPPIQCRTMGIWSTGDHALTEVQMKGSGAYVEGPWRYERLEGPGHWLPLEIPDVLNALLIDFLAG
ncbi:MAG: alpha/beta fold hydrolase [Actinomycetes bacterium]